MVDVIWHGRGGQGAFTAARLLGAAWCYEQGHQALAFPTFGPERRGAPMCAFTRLDTGPIGVRGAPAQADVVVYLDDTLLSSGWEQELTAGGVVLVNTARTIDDSRVVCLDASAISTELLGRAIPNTALLAALTNLIEGFTAKTLNRAISEQLPARLHAGNHAVVERVCAMEVGVPSVAPAVSESNALADNQDIPASHLDVPAGHSNASTDSSDIPVGPPSGTPFIRARKPQPADYARATCFTAGYLVENNAGWRERRPVVDAQRCTGCLQCYLYCPDGAIKRTPSAAVVVSVDTEFCKGCAVCEQVCPFDAISMVSEATIKQNAAIQYSSAKSGADTAGTSDNRRTATGAMNKEK